MNRSIFITGTDTGVGKTMLTAALLMAYRYDGVDAVPFKPVQTGCEPDATGFLRAPDVDLCLRLAGLHDIGPNKYKELAPFRYPLACSPHLAAEQAGETIDLNALLDSARRLASQHEVVLAEGAGGVCVPLNRQETMLDLMARLGWPVLIAARPGLGTLNHTALTVQAVRRHELPLLGIVVVHASPPSGDFIEADNLRTLPWLCDGPVLGEIPYAGQDENSMPINAEAIRRAGQRILLALRNPSSGNPASSVTHTDEPQDQWPI